MNISARRILFSSFTFWIALGALALYSLFPLRQSLKFGIDLVGGTYITLEVQTEKAIEDSFQRKAQSFAAKFDKAGLTEPTSKKVTAQENRLNFSSS